MSSARNGRFAAFMQPRIHRNLAAIAVLLILSCACGLLPPSEVPEAPAGSAPAVVFDIDGTLTPQVLAIYKARPDAARVAQALSGKGYLIIYLSARSTGFSAGIPGWLRKHGFPEGIVHVAQTAGDHKDPATFKAQILERYTSSGWELRLAYGDSSTDFEAYAEVGIPPQHVFALSRGGRACEPGAWSACLAGWSGHLDYVERSVEPVSPE